MIIIRKRVEIDFQHLRDLDQQMRRQRPLIVLDEIEIARRDLQLGREIRLREVLATTDGPDFGAEGVHGCPAIVAPGLLLTPARWYSFCSIRPMSETGEH